MQLSKAKHFLPFIIAAACGKRIQVNQGNERWETQGMLNFGGQPDKYRIHPDDVAAPLPDVADDRKEWCGLFYRQHGTPKWQCYQLFSTIDDANAKARGVFGIRNDLEYVTIPVKLPR